MSTVQVDWKEFPHFVDVLVHLKENGMEFDFTIIGSTETRGIETAIVSENEEAQMLLKLMGFER